jgi:cyclophilin family peptidyl-prolyl cis-trans isomerase
VFGQVSSGMEAVDAIEGLETGAGDRPVEDARIERMEVKSGE